MCFHPINWNLAEAIGLSVITDKTLYLQFFEFHNVCFLCVRNLLVYYLLQFSCFSIGILSKLSWTRTSMAILAAVEQKILSCMLYKLLNMSCYLLLFNLPAAVH